MHRHESAALILRRKLFAGIKQKVEDRHVRLQKNIAGDGLGHQVRPLAFVSRFFVRSGIRVGPSVKRALLNVREIVRHQIVSQGIPFLNGRPQVIRVRIPVQTDRITRARGKDLVAAAVRIETIDGRAHGVLAGVHVRAGAYAHV